MKNCSKSEYVITRRPTWVRKRWLGSVTGVACHGWSLTGVRGVMGSNHGGNPLFLGCQIGMRWARNPCSVRVTWQDSWQRGWQTYWKFTCSLTCSHVWNKMLLHHYFKRNLSNICYVANNPDQSGFFQYPISLYFRTGNKCWNFCGGAGYYDIT